MARNCRFPVAVHIAALLAVNAGGAPLTSEVIAASVDTHPVVVRRLLSALAKAGLVTSLRGALGGSHLAMAADRVSLLDIQRAVDDDDGPAVPQPAPDAACAVAQNIGAVLTKVLAEAESARNWVLSSVTVAAVAQMIRDKAAT